MSKIIITGNPVQGFQYFGPFGELTEEITDQLETDWWVTDLEELQIETEKGAILLSDPTAEVVIQATFDSFRLAGADDKTIAEVRDAITNNWESLGSGRTVLRNLLSDDIKTGNVTTCLYCHRSITEVIDSVSGVVDWGDDGDFGCGDNPINDEEGTGAHHPNTNFRQAGYRLSGEELLEVLQKVSAS